VLVTTSVYDVGVSVGDVDVDVDGMAVVGASVELGTSVNVVLVVGTANEVSEYCVTGAGVGVGSADVSLVVNASEEVVPGSAVVLGCTSNSVSELWMIGASGVMAGPTLPDVALRSIEMLVASVVEAGVEVESTSVVLEVSVVEAASEPLEASVMGADVDPRSVNVLLAYALATGLVVLLLGTASEVCVSPETGASRGRSPLPYTPLLL